MEVHTGRVCCAHRSIRIIDMPDGSQSMRSEMRPAGPLSDYLRKMIEEKEAEAIVFGYRMVSFDFTDKEVTVDSIVTVDLVP